MKSNCYEVHSTLLRITGRIVSSSSVVSVVNYISSYLDGDTKSLCFLCLVVSTKRTQLEGQSLLTLEQIYFTKRQPKSNESQQTSGDLT